MATTNVARPRDTRIQSQRNRRVGQIGSASGKFFNDFPKIMAALPGALSDIVRETTEDVAQEARAMAPIGKARKDAPKPGTLRKSIKTRYSKRRSDGMVLQGRIDAKAFEKEKSDPKHLYAWYVEWGTVHTPSRHFMVPALISNRPTFLAKLQHLEGRL